jgi:hypothetical protein
MKAREADSVVTEREAPLLSIGEFSRRSWLSLKALRLYDRLGLLTPAHVDEGSGYRRYREEQLETARLIAMLRRRDVRGRGTRGARAGRPDAEAARARAAGVDLGSRRPTPARRGGTRRHGGTDFVVYHGAVNEDSDGPVEVCIPVGVAADQAGDVAARREPAHREAYVRITKAQVAYPQILSAFDAVGEWIRSEGRTVEGSPREIYFADWDAAGPDDEVCDVAFPVS